MIISLLIISLVLAGKKFNKIYDTSIAFDCVSIISSSIGSSYSCWIKSGYNMKCFGSNSNKQLGLGDDTASRGDDVNEMGGNLAYVNPGSGTKFKSIYCGSTHTCAIYENGVAAKCWGLNQDGQLGIGSSDTGNIGNTGDTLPLIDFGDTDNIKPISFAVGSIHTCMLFDNKKVKCFGNGVSGKLGYENQNNIGSLSSDMGNNLPFVNLGSDILVSSIHSFGRADHNCIIIDVSQLMKCWGRNDLYQLGYNDNISRGHAVDTMGDKILTLNLGTESKVLQISVGASHTCAIRIDNELVCWGGNGSGKLGLGTTTTPIPTSSPEFVVIKVDSDTTKKAKYVSAGNDNTCVLLDDDISVRCVGSNGNGQLGQGDTTTRGDTASNTMDKFPAINLGTGSLKIASINAGFQYACVLFEDSSVKCFGNGNNGRLGLGSTSSFGGFITHMGVNLPKVDIFEITLTPTKNPTNKPTSAPSKLTIPTVPFKNPTSAPTKLTIPTVPFKNPTNKPTSAPFVIPTFTPSKNPTTKPTSSPSKKPNNEPTNKPTLDPTKRPTDKPSQNPTPRPTLNPTKKPTDRPSKNPTPRPTDKPSKNPTPRPTLNPTKKPTTKPSQNPTPRPTLNPTNRPTTKPSKNPTSKPTKKPTKNPTWKPSKNPTKRPTKKPN